jgi:guanylate kinase
MDKIGKIIIISGPSGVGKGTLIKDVQTHFPQIGLAVSATTRLPREGEKEGKSYYFMSNDTFQKHIDDDDFLEWCPVHAHKYGTLKKEVLRYTDRGQNVILEIDVEGAKKVKLQNPDAISIFIAPPSLDTLEDRLKKRRTESESVIQERLRIAQHELSQSPFYDTVIINTTISESLNHFITFIKKECPL